MKFRQFCNSLLLGLVLVTGLAVNTAMACPMCKNATETDDRKPQAYMYSILFMMAVPATIFTGFGITFYRLSRKANQEYENPADYATDIDQEFTE